MREVKDKHIVVIGAARSGSAAALLLHRKGASVFVSDSSTIDEHVKDQLQQANIAFEEKGHTEQALKGDFAVLSPGVPTAAPPVQRYLKNGKEVFSELEVASWFNRSPIIAVTGSNGKTTVSSWLDHTWKVADKPHVLAGNIGYAFSDKVDDTASDRHAILEVSSFQLDHIDTFRPTISLLLNITADHLDRYENSIEKYAAAKFRITENQQGEDWFIYNFEDERIRKHAEDLKKKAGAPNFWPFQAEKKYPVELLYGTKKLSSESTKKTRYLCQQVK